MILYLLALTAEYYCRWNG